jgi:hypothetical protein
MCRGHAPRSKRSLWCMTAAGVIPHALAVVRLRRRAVGGWCRDVEVEIEGRTVIVISGDPAETFRCSKGAQCAVVLAVPIAGKCFE